MSLLCPPILRRGGAALLALAVLSSGVVASEPWKRHTIDRSSRGADGVRLGDVNRDGRMDIATGWEEGGLVRVYLHPGTERVRHEWPAVTVGVVRAVEDAVFAELDGDGALDVVSCAEGRERTVYVHWAPLDAARVLDPAAWRTEAIPATRGREAWMYAVPLDVDGRFGADLVVGSKGDGAGISWLEAPETPRDLAAWRLHRVRDAGWIMSLEAFDMDGDGDRDVLFSDRKGPRRGVFWLERSGGLEAHQGGARWREHAVAPDLGETMFLAVAGGAGDTPRSIACAVKGAGLAWLRRTADATEDSTVEATEDAPDGAASWTRASIPIPAGCGTAKAAAVGDIDRDGESDLVFSCEHAGDGRSGVRWLARDGRSTGGKDRWREHEVSGPEGAKFDRMELLDLDGDGDLDILTCEETENLGVVWYENPLDDR